MADDKGGKVVINSVSLTGRLTRPMDLRYTQSGIAVGRFSLAVDRQFVNPSGQREADFVNCIIWRKGAENLDKFTRKGSLIGVMGRIQTGQYTSQQGQTIYTTDVVVESFTLLESKATTEARPQPQSTPSPSNAGQQPPVGQPDPLDDNQLPF